MNDADITNEQLVAEMTALRQRLVALETAEVKRQQAEETLQHQNALLHSISQIQSEFIVDADPQVSFERLLHTLLTLTHSEYGFIGELRYSATGDPYLKMYAITNIAWDRDSQAFYERHKPEGLEFHNMQTLFGMVITTGKAVMANDPSTDPRRGGLPEGHPPLRAFLGLPFARGGTVIGMVGLANRPSGYDQALIECLQPVLLTCGVMVDAYRQAQQRQQAEDALRESEQRYRTLVETCLQGLSIVTQDYIRVYANQTLATMLGYEHPDELIGVPAWHNIVPSSLDTLRCYGEARRRGEPVPTWYTYQRRKKDGTPIWIEQRLTQIPWKGEMAYLATLVDVSDRIQAEQALQQAHETLERRVAARTAALPCANTQLQAEMAQRQQAETALSAGETHFGALVQHASDIIALLTADGIVRYYSPAMQRVLGYDPDEMIGRHIFGAIHPDDVPTVKRVIAHLVQHPGTTQAVDYRVRHRDGSWRHFEAVGIYPCDEYSTGWLVVNARDITARKQTEEALRASEERFRNLIEGSLQGILIHRDNKALFANQAYADIFGYATPDMLYTLESLSSLIAPHDRERLLRYRDARLAGVSVPSFYEYQGLRQDGSLVWLEMCVRLVTWQGALAVQSTVVDITARKKAEEVVRQSAARFAKVFQVSPVAMGITRLRDGCYLAVNESFLRTTGYQRHEVLGYTSLDLDRWVDHETRRQVAEHLLAYGAVQEVETSLRIKSGAIRDTLLSATRIEMDGEPCILVITQDITEQKRAYTALRTSEELNRRIVEAVPGGIIQVSQDGRIVHANVQAQRILGLAYDDLTQRFVADFAPQTVWEDGSPCAIDDYPVTKCLATHQPQPATTIGVRRLDGTVIWAVFTAIPLADPVTAQATGAVVTFLDITERKQAEEERQRLEAQLRQSQKMEAIGTLAGGIAHEFNNALSVILGFTELTQRDMLPGSRAWSNLQEVLNASHRSKTLVQQILAFSHPSDHKQEPVNLALVIQEALKLLRASLPSTIEIRQQMTPGIGRVLADAAQIHQVLINLCANAECAMRESGGILEIGVDAVEIDDAFAACHPELQPGAYVCVKVRDTGAGISADVVDRIFEPFFTTKGVGEGTGMGLAIVHGIVSSHGGAITVESKRGEGTTFSVYLPRLTDVFCDTPQVLEQVIPRGQGRLLFVDDEEVLARLGQMLLEQLGYDVVVCTNALTALEVFQQEPYRFDVVITDQTMPAMTGATLVEELRRIRSDIPIILCTGFSHLMNAEKAEALGVDAFVMKPGVTQELTVTIQQVLEQRAQQRT